MSPEHTWDRSPAVTNTGCHEPTVWPGLASQCPFWNLTQPGPDLPLSRPARQGHRPNRCDRKHPTQLGDSLNTESELGSRAGAVSAYVHEVFPKRPLPKTSRAFTSARDVRALRAAHAPSPARWRSHCSRIYPDLEGHERSLSPCPVRCTPLGTARVLLQLRFCCVPCPSPGGEACRETRVRPVTAVHGEQDTEGRNRGKGFPATPGESLTHLGSCPRLRQTGRVGTPTCAGRRSVGLP